MFKFVLIATVLGCALAAPTPYDNPTKTWNLQEASKYHPTAQNRHQVPETTISTVELNPVKIAHEESVSVKVEGPTPVPVHKREAHHNPEHTQEQEDKKKEEEQKPAVIPVEDDKEAEKTISGNSEGKEKSHTPCGHSCSLDHQHHKRGASPVTTKETITTEVTHIHFDNTKPEAKNEDKKESEEEKTPTTSKTVSKREDVTSEKASETTTKAAVHLTPTAVHSSFSHTWTRPQAPVAAAASVDDKTPAASEFKPVLASIDPFKPIVAVHEPIPSTTTAASAVRRVRRGLDETEEQDQPKDPKPTKAWWRSLTFGKSSSEEEVKEAEKKKKTEETSTTAATVKLTKDEDKKVPVSAPVSATKDLKDVKDKVTQKRETPAEELKKPSEGTPATSTVKPVQKQVEVQNNDSKAPQFVHPVPVAQILGHKQAEIAAVHKKSTSSEEDKKKSSSSEETKKASEEHKVPSQKNVQKIPVAATKSSN